MKESELQASLESMNPLQRKEWHRLRDQVRNQARGEQRCGQVDYRKCCGDCQICSWHIQGNVLSLDDEHTASLCPSVPGPEEDFATRDLMQRIYLLADTLCLHGGAILQKKFEEEKSSYQIAEELEMPQRTVAKYLNELLAYLRRHRREFL